MTNKKTPKTTIYILNLETATKNCSVSISKNGELVALKEVCEAQFSHAEKLNDFIQDCLNQASLAYQDLSAVAISKGPGSFTGLRIGVSTAKGLCFGLDIPLISILTLKSLAHIVEVKTGFIIPLLDARRMEVYTAIFDYNYKVIKETYNYVLEEGAFLEYLEKGKVTFIGDGTLKTSEIIRHKNAIFINNLFPSAKEMSPLSYQKYLNNNFENLAYFEPFYLKDFYVAPSKKNTHKI